MTIGLYLVTPFLRGFVSKAKLGLVKLYLLIAVLTQFTLPILGIFDQKFKYIKLIASVLEDCHLDFLPGTFPISCWVGI